MRIAHVIFSMNVGGAETMLADIMREQTAAGHEVHLVMINEDYNPELLERAAQGAVVHKIGRRPGSRNPWPLIKHNLVLRRLKPDIVHFHTDQCASLTLPLRGVPFVGTAHAMQLSLNHMVKLNRCFAISEAVGKDILQRYGSIAPVVANGVDFNALRHKTNWHIAGNPLRIIQVSNLLHEIKGQDVVIRAIKILQDKGLDVSIDFVGKGPSKEYLRNLAKELGVADRVHFLGARPRPWVYSNLADYDLFVQASRFEGFGLTLVEAMGAKVPVIASDIDGPAEIVGRNNDHGTLFRSGDESSLAHAIEEFIANPEPANAIARGDAFDYVTAHYSIRQTAQSYLRHYEELLGK